MSPEPEWNISYADHDAVVLGLKHNHSIKEKIKTYVDTVGWSIVLESLMELSDTIPACDEKSISRKTKLINALCLAHKSYTHGQTK
jgi:hypothetical protein